MNYTRNLVLYFTLLGIIALTIIGSTKVLAQTASSSPSSLNSTTSQTNPSVIEKLAEKFGLKIEDVKSVFDEQHQEMEINRQTQFEARLDQLVKDGKLTAAQKQAVLNKQSEFKTKRETERTELENWAKSQGIDLQTIGLFKKGFGGHGGYRMHW